MLTYNFNNLLAPAIDTSCVTSRMDPFRKMIMTLCRVFSLLENALNSLTCDSK